MLSQYLLNFSRCPSAQQNVSWGVFGVPWGSVYIYGDILSDPPLVLGFGVGFNDLRFGRFLGLRYPSYVLWLDFFLPIGLNLILGTSNLVQFYSIIREEQRWTRRKKNMV